MTGKEGVTQNYGPLNNKPHAVTATSAGLALDYDANGNLASKAGPGRLPQQFIYDAENRLVEVTSPTPGVRLSPGWNFVSFPQVSGEVPVSAVISNFVGNCEQVTRFNSQSNYFESFVNSTNFDQFATVSVGRGYGLYVTNAAGLILPLGTTPAAPVPQTLTPGLHLLPGPAQTMTVSNWLVGLAGGVDYGDVKGWTPALGAVTNVTTVRPGQAYYVAILRTSEWTPPAAGSIENPSDVRFVYDGDGGRVKKITWRGTTLFLGQSYEVSPEGQPTLYVFAGGQRVAAKEANGSLRIYHTDHLGSANVITDQNGSAVEVTENNPYGSICREEGTVNVAHKFTGQRLDDETGLYFYNARYYDPEIGRFCSADSLIQNPSDPQTLNRYTYAGNNPVLYVDPSGHFFFLPFIASVVWGALQGAAVGAVLGAVTAVITHQDVWRGALNGALQGAISGAVSGAINFAFNTMTTALSKANGLSAAQKQFFGQALSVGRSAIQGGAAEALSGGSFGRGAAIGAITPVSRLLVKTMGISGGRAYLASGVLEQVGEDLVSGRARVENLGGAIGLGFLRGGNEFFDDLGSLDLAAADVYGRFAAVGASWGGADQWGATKAYLGTRALFSIRPFCTHMAGLASGALANKLTDGNRYAASAASFFGKAAGFESSGFEEAKFNLEAKKVDVKFRVYGKQFELPVDLK